MAMVFRLRGRLSLSQGADLRKQFWEAVYGGRTRKLILELSGVSELDPSTISLFIATRHMVDKRHGRLLLAGLNEAHYQVLSRTSLLDYFDICETVAEALEK